MKKLLMFVGCGIAVIATGCRGSGTQDVQSSGSSSAPEGRTSKAAHQDADDDEDEGDEDEQEIALSEVPQAALDAARAEVKGIELEEACIEVEDGVTLYCIEGELNGVEYEIEVTADGKVVEVEKGDDDDDDDDEDDDNR